MRLGKVEFLTAFGASTLQTLFTNVGFKTSEDFLDDLVLARIELSVITPFVWGSQESTL